MGGETVHRVSDAFGSSFAHVLRADNCGEIASEAGGRGHTI